MGSEHMICTLDSEVQDKGYRLIKTDRKYALPMLFIMGSFTGLLHICINGHPCTCPLGLFLSYVCKVFAFQFCGCFLLRTPLY